MDMHINNFLRRYITRAAGVLAIQMNIGKVMSDTGSQRQPAAAGMGVIVAPAII